MPASATRALRLLVAVAGGYAFAAGLVAVISATLPQLAMAATEAATLGALLGILAYVAIFVWVAASTRPLRTMLIVLTAAAIMIVGAPLMAAG